MAQSGYERTKDDMQPGDAAPKVSGQRARQGQNVRGMLAVLVVGTLLVVIAYAIMLALRVEPSSVTEASRNEAAAATQGASPAQQQAGQQQPGQQ